MMFVEQDLYQVLCLHSSAVAVEIRKAYHQAALCAHPDKGGTTEMFHLVSLAFEVLSCPAARKAYDDMRNSCEHKSVERKKKRKYVSAQVIETRRSKRQCTMKGPGLSEDPLCCSPQAHHALESLRVVLQEMPPNERLAAISGMDRQIRAALTYHMEQTTTESEVDRKVNRCLTERSNHLPIAQEVRKPHRVVWIGNGVHRYKARINFFSLCLYGRWQADLDTAMEHQIALVRIRNAIMTEAAKDTELCKKPKRAFEICRSVLAECQVQECKLGLVAYVSMRAYGCRIESPALPIEQAWALRARLMEARSTSWEQCQEIWIHLLCQGRKHMTAMAAEDVVEKARKCSLQTQCVKAVARVGKVLQLGL